MLCDTFIFCYFFFLCATVCSLVSWKGAEEIVRSLCRGTAGRLFSCAKDGLKKCTQGLSMNTEEGLPHRVHLLCWCAKCECEGVSWCKMVALSPCKKESIGVLFVNFCRQSSKVKFVLPDPQLP